MNKIIRISLYFGFFASASVYAATADRSADGERMPAHLNTADYGDSDIHVFTDPDRPNEGDMVVKLVGSDSSRPGALLLVHIDVVEAKRADWVRDPFPLIEEGGYFYGRGTSDDKTMAAVLSICWCASNRKDTNQSLPSSWR